MNRRFARQIAIPEIGEEGQLRLGEASVLIVGCGALGSMAAMQLAGAGVGHIRIADFDTVDISNLHRQLFFTDAEAGMPKATVLARRMRELNPEVRVEVCEGMATRHNIDDLMDGCVMALDATDNAESMLLVDAASQTVGIPCTFAGIREFSGQVTTCIPGGVRYADIFPGAASAAGSILPCEAMGVAGPAAAVAASIQAAEAIKYITKSGSLLSGRLLLFDLLEMRFSMVSL